MGLVIPIHKIFFGFMMWISYSTEEVPGFYNLSETDEKHLLLFLQ